MPLTSFDNGGFENKVRDDSGETWYHSVGENWQTTNGKNSRQ